MPRTTGTPRTATFGTEQVTAFIPNPLPPDPPLAWTAEDRDLHDEALTELSRLDGIVQFLPNVQLFLYMYVRKEAVLSSQIEGTQSSLSDLLFFETNQRPAASLEDITEVSNYVSALNHGIRRLEEGFPLSNRLLREIHGKLLQTGRGSDKEPGEFRRSQNWIGGSRPGTAAFVPPPPGEVQRCMGELEAFFHQEKGVSALVQAGLSHVQFETIHPFLDGNGRVGRLLITLLLYHRRKLRQPILYLSLFFKQHRTEYYRLLQLVREEGDWEAWMRFFLRGVQETSANAYQTSESLVHLFQQDAATISGLPGNQSSVLDVHQALQQSPLSTVAHLSDRTGMAPNTVTNALEKLIQLNMVREITGRKRKRIFAYIQYLDTINEGTELPGK